jgi:hypothetical protein
MSYIFVSSGIIFFFCATSSCGLWTICFFLERISSPGCVQWTTDSTSKSFSSKLLCILKLYSKNSHTFWATDPVFSPTLWPGYMYHCNRNDTHCFFKVVSFRYWVTVQIYIALRGRIVSQVFLKWKWTGQFASLDSHDFMGLLGQESSEPLFPQVTSGKASWLFVFETRSPSVAKASLKFVVLLPLAPKCHDYRHALPCSV